MEKEKSPIELGDLVVTSGAKGAHLALSGKAKRDNLKDAINGGCENLFFTGVIITGAMVGLGLIRAIDEIGFPAAVSQVKYAFADVAWKTATASTLFYTIKRIALNDKIRKEKEYNKAYLAEHMADRTKYYSLEQAQPTQDNINRLAMYVSGAVAIVSSVANYGAYSADRALEEYKKQAVEKTVVMTEAPAQKIAPYTYVMP